MSGPMTISQLTAEYGSPSSDTLLEVQTVLSTELYHLENPNTKYFPSWEGFRNNKVENIIFS